MSAIAKLPLETCHCLTAATLLVMMVKSEGNQVDTMNIDRYFVCFCVCMRSFFILHIKA